MKHNLMSSGSDRLMGSKGTATVRCYEVENIFNSLDVSCLWHLQTNWGGG